jgi:hypothetical protein
MSIRRMMLFTLGAKIKNLIQAFKERVLATQGQFEAETCLDSQLTDLDNQSLLDSASLIVTPNGYKENLLYAVEPNEVGTNLFLRSEEFENTGVWVRQNILSISTNVANSPIGTLTTDKIIPDTTLNQHRIFQQFNFSGQGVLSVYAKADGYNFLSLAISGGLTGQSIYFNLSNGTISGTASGFTPSIESVGNGWYRCSIYNATLGQGVNLSYWIIARESETTNNYTGNGTSGILVWGAQLVEGSTVTDYIPTTDRAIINGTIGDMSVTRATTATRVNELGEIEVVPYNLFQRSEEFEQAIWTKTAVSIIQNTQISPIGNLTADTLRIGVDASSVRHRLFQQLFTQSGTTYTTSYYLKKANHRWIQLNYVSDTVFGISNWANFDLENGVIGNTGPGAIATITDVGNGWYRCTLQAIAITSINTTSCEIIVINNTNSGRYPSYQSTIAEDVCYVWGAQLVTGSSAKDYFPTTNRFNVPRIDYSNGSCPSILVEPQSTNQIRNNSMVGAVVGNPGTLPTNWFQSLIGMSREVVGLGIENGVNYIDVRIYGTAGGAGTALQRIIFEQATQIAAANGQTWTLSNYVKIIAQPLPPTIYRFVMFELTSAGGFVTAGFQNITPTTTLQRFRFTRTLSGGATVARVQPIFEFNTVTGQAYDFTIRIGMPQMEQQSVATSIIPTTTAAVTRNADVITNTNASTLIGQTEGVIYIQTSRQVITSTGGWIFRIDDNTENNRLGIFSLANTGNLAVNISRSGVGLDIMTYNNFLSLTNQGNAKIALAYKNGDFALAVNGAIVATSSNSGTIPFMNSCRSSTIGGGLIPNQSTNCISLFKTRLTNTQLQQLTTL